jgi:hypothetical protein
MRSMIRIHPSISRKRIRGAAQQDFTLGISRDAPRIAVFTQKGVNPWKWMPDEIQTRGNARAFAEAPGTPKP